jgi:hypothetical protein
MITTTVMARQVRLDARGEDAIILHSSPSSWISDVRAGGGERSEREVREVDTPEISVDVSYKFSFILHSTLRIKLVEYNISKKHISLDRNRVITYAQARRLSFLFLAS